MTIPAYYGNFFITAPSKPPSVEIRNGETPKKQQQSKRNSMHKETLDAVIISNSSADSPTKQTNSSPPNVDDALVKASKGKHPYTEYAEKNFTCLKSHNAENE